MGRKGWGLTGEMHEKSETGSINLNHTIFNTFGESGTCGGTLSAWLRRTGSHVILLEGGPEIDTRRSFSMHDLLYECKNRLVPFMAPGEDGFTDGRIRILQINSLFPSCIG